MSVFQRTSDIPGLNNAKGFVVNGCVEVHEDIVINDPLWAMGVIVPDKDVEVQINGPFTCGAHQAFDLSKGGIITGRPEIAEVNPCWWGANPNGVGNSSPAINQAIQFCNGPYKPAIQFVAGQYICLDFIVKEQTFYMPQIRGIGGGNMSEPGGVVLDFRQAEGNDCVYIKGGSGTLVNGGMSNLTIMAKGEQVPLRIADQGGAVIANCQFIGGLDSVQMHNEAPNGFTEWNKLINCTMMYPTRNGLRFRANGHATDSFHGAEVIDCWFQITNGAPAAIHVEDHCYWYNGTCKARVFFHGNPGKYQDVIHVDSGARDVEIEGYFKTEGGYGWGRLGSGRTIWFAGEVVCLGSINWGTVIPVEYYFRGGPEAGAGNGAGYSMIRGLSHSRSITVDENGNAPVGLYVPGAMDCEITVRAGNYEYNITGIARPQYSGMNGAWNKTASWCMTNHTGWGEPSFWVGSDNALYIQNKNYPPGAVKLHIWYRQRSMSAAMGKYMTQNPG